MNSTLQQTPIAVIGMAGIFPEASNLQEYWENILQKRDCIREVPPSRWSLDDYYDPDPNVPDKTYCKRGGFIPDIDFDPLEFGLPPNSLEVTDVSQLLALVVAKRAIIDAGYGAATDDVRARTGVILGIGGGQKLITPLTSRLQYPLWEKVLHSAGLSTADTETILEKIKLGYIEWNENSFPGMLGNVIAGRVANRLDLGGINCVVDAACASSLSALQMAVSELTEQRADMMITGGVDTDNSPFMYMSFSKTPALSKAGQTRPFDAESDGMMLGEGIGMLVLKRLADAEQEGDRIYAVIKGIGAASDGRYKSIYAPRASGQERALRRAYAAAGFDPTTVGLLEAHGTGTKAGDPVELSALQQVFDAPTETIHPLHAPSIALGSVKSQIGHTKSAAGVASLIKTVLALHHKILPPTINVTTPNAALTNKASALYLNTETRPWIASAKPRNASSKPDEQLRRAGVSSFGFGGTNFHVALEEYQSEQEQAYRLHKVPAMILLCATSPEQLHTLCQQWIEHLTGTDAPQQFASLVAACRQRHPTPDEARIGFTATTVDGAVEQLQRASERLATVCDVAWEHPKGIYYRPHVPHSASHNDTTGGTSESTTGKVVALFSGQGSQAVGMGRTLSLNFPEVRRAHATMDQLLLADGLLPLSSVLFPPPGFTAQERDQQTEQLQRTEYAQPAIGLLSFSLYQLLRRAGLQPDFVAGHSFGELTALWAAGVLTDDHYFALVKSRGQAMAAPSEPGFDTGAMLAVQAEMAQVRTLLSGPYIENLEDIVYANVNSPKQIVLAGPGAVIAQAQERLEQQGILTRQLPVSAAFHTPLVGHAVEPFTQAVQATPFHPAQIPVYANSTGAPYPAEQSAMHETLAAQICRPVLFQQTIENLYKAGARIFVEIGPKAILTNLVKEILHNQPHVAVAVNANAREDSDRQLRQAIVQLRVAGLYLGDFDPYAAAPAALSTNGTGKFTVRLNGANYVSEPTQNAFATALADDFQITAPAANRLAQDPNSSPANGTVLPQHHAGHSAHNGTVAVNGHSKNNGHAALQPTPPPIPTSHSHNGEELTQLLHQFYTIQADLLQAHQHYLDHHMEESSTFFQLIAQQQQLMQQLGPTALNQGTLADSMARFQSHQTETLRLHERYLNNQLRYLELLFQQLRPLPHSTGNGVSSTIQTFVATNGHEATAPSTAVAHAAAPQHGPSQHPAVYPLAPDQPINGRGAEQRPLPSMPLVDASPVDRSLPIEHPQTPATVAPAVDRAAATIAAQFVAVVSDKTGYPAELLELEMDMEADLGIDSIKRVEILGVMQEQIPNLPTLRAAELAELRTLQQVVDHVQQKLVHNQQEPHQAAPSQLANQPPAQLAPTAQADALPTNSAIAERFVAVVSDKTGYPAELLELEMDMEADLGIDSIKRVEILGVMQEQIPNLPTLRAAELAELRTLQQVVDHVQHQLVRNQPAQPAHTNGFTTDVHPAEKVDSEEHPIQSYSVVLKPLPAPDALERTLPPGHCCLVTDSGDAMTLHLVQQLVTQGWPVAVLSLSTLFRTPTAELPPQVVHYHLADMAEATFVAQLQQIEADTGPIAAVLYLDPDWKGLPAQAAPSSGLEQWLSPVAEACVQRLFLLAKYVGPALQQAANKGSATFMAVTRLDGKLGVGGQGGSYSAVSGGLFGLVKALNHEWSGVFCRAVDLAPSLAAEQAAKQIMTEIYDPNRLVTEVGYDGTQRVTLTTAPLAQEDRASLHNGSDSEQAIGSEQIFLVSGGARGVTAQCVIALAQQTESTFILLGRTTRHAEPPWAQGIVEESRLKRQIATQLQADGVRATPQAIAAEFHAITARREIEATLAAIRAAGGQVDYFSVDISKESDLQQTVATVQERWGTITGIIHGAGVLADKRIEQKSMADFERVYGVKVTGLHNLLAAVDPAQLQSLVLFSSAAGFYGNAGQTDYALANEVLNKLAHLLDHHLPTCRVLAINWGPWDGGMVSTALKAHFAQQQIDLIPQAVGAQILVQQLCAPPTPLAPPVQTVVGGALVPPAAEHDATLRSYRIRRTLDERANPFLQDHRIGGHAVLPITCAGSWLVHACEQQYPGFTFFRGQQFKVFKGIVFDESLADSYILELQELEKQQDAVRFEATLLSTTNQGRPRYHYRLECEVRRTIPTPPPIVKHFDQTNAHAAQRYYTDGTLFHGPRFQGIQRIITLDGQQIVMACRLPAITPAEQGQFPVHTFNPYTADTMFQGLLLWVRHHYQAGSLPLHAGSNTQYRPVNFDQTFYIDTQIIEHNAQRAVANITIYNGHGELCSQTEGAAVTISKELNQLFRGEA